MTVKQGDTGERTKPERPLRLSKILVAKLGALYRTPRLEFLSSGSYPEIDVGKKRSASHFLHRCSSI